VQYVPADEDWYIEASKLLDRVKELDRESLKVFRYFVDNVSVGVIRAERELSRKGVKDPAEAIERLISLGLLEKGDYSYSLSRPLRMLRARRGGIPL
jgi:hypothetical protein